MHKHQEAVEQAVEPDVPQAEDEVSKYLRELGIHVRIDAKGAVPGDVLRSFQAANIDQNVGLMRKLIAKVQITNVSEDVEVEDADHYVQVLENHLVASPENEMRRNWFNSVIPAGMRVEDTRRVEAPPSPWEDVNVPPRPTARMDDGSKLLRPRAKKGARPRELSRSRPPARFEDPWMQRLNQFQADEDYDEQRANIIHNLTEQDYNSTRRFLSRREG